MAARLDPHKGHFQLIDAVANSVDALGLRITLSFIGTDTDKICLPKTITSRESFIDRDFEIEFLGPVVDVSEKAFWFSNLDIYVMASQYLEGFPNSLYEAVAIGCPYVSTSSGNVNEFLESKYLCHSYTSESITDRLLFLMNTPAITLKQDIQKSQARLKIAANPQTVSNAYKNLWLNY
jgi:glycosyltransferase involved in cell wall biosynthesis